MEDVAHRVDTSRSQESANVLDGAVSVASWENLQSTYESSRGFERERFLRRPMLISVMFSAADWLLGPPGPPR